MIRAGEFFAENLIASSSPPSPADADDHQPLRQLEGRLDRIGQPRANFRLEHDAIDDRFDVVGEGFLQSRRRSPASQFDNLAIDPGAHKSLLVNAPKSLLVLALLPAHQRRQDHHLGAGRMLHHRIDDLLADWLEITRPHTQQCGVPARANSTRR